MSRTSLLYMLRGHDVIKLLLVLPHFIDLINRNAGGLPYLSSILLAYEIALNLAAEVVFERRRHGDSEGWGIHGRQWQQEGLTELLITYSFNSTRQ